MRSELLRAATYLLALTVLFILLRVLGPVLAPFVAAAILAYVFVPLVERLQRCRLGRSAASAVVLLVLLAALVGLLLVLVPLLDRQLAGLRSGLPALVDWARNQAVPWVSTTFGVEIPLDVDAIKVTLLRQVEDNGHAVAGWAGSLTSGGLALAGVLATVALVPLVLFYFLRDWPRMLGALGELVPRRHLAAVRSAAAEIDGVLGEFLRGQLAVMAALAAYYTLALRLAGLDSALSIGILTGLFAFVPYLGFGLGLCLSVLASVTQFHGGGGLLPVLVVYGIGQVLEGYALTPFLVGERIGLHPVVVILAVLSFGQLLGFVGVLLALPLAASSLVLLRRARVRYLASRLYRE